MANTLVMTENSNLVQWLSEWTPILEPTDSRVFQAQTRRGVMETTQVSSENSRGSFEVGELGSQ